MKPKASLVKMFLSSALTLSLAMAMASQADAANLGVAQSYNGFILGDATVIDANLINSDTQGRLAVGGNLNAQNYSINSQSVTPGPALVVGGNLTFTNGQVNGAAVVSGTATTTGVNFTGGLTANAGAGIPIDFATARTFYGNYANQLGGLAATGTTSLQFGGLSLTGTNSSFNVFTTSLSQLSSISSFTLNAPSTSTILINITGAGPATLQNFGFNYIGANKQNVLFNFYQATQLSFTSVGVLGSVLAPTAEIKASNGNFQGTLIAATYQNLSTGNTSELENFAFTGNLPTAVPEPSGLLGLLGFGVAGGAVFMVKHRRRTAKPISA